MSLHGLNSVVNNGGYIIMTAEWLKSLLEKVDDDYEVKILDFRSELELDISNVRIDLENKVIVFEEDIK
jgi:hypothetical protein